EAGCDVGDVELRLDDRLAAVARLELGQLVRAVAHDLGELEQHAAAILRRRVLPRARVEGGAGGSHRGIDVLRVGVRGLRDDLGGGGVDDVDGCAGRRVDVLAVDVKLIWFHGTRNHHYIPRFIGAGNDHSR